MLTKEEKDALKQILKDAGCCQEQTDRFLDCRENKSCGEQLDILSNYRRQLLEKNHQVQHQLECLDYLMYKIKEGKEIG